MNANSHGLGLNICQKIAIGLGGLITFSSEKQIGSKFKFTFGATGHLKKELSDSGNDKIVSSSFFYQIQSGQEAVERARRRLQFIVNRQSTSSKEIVRKDLNPILENQESQFSDNDFQAQREVMVHSFPEASKTKFDGLIMVADDQHLNLEVLKQHMRAIGIQDKVAYFFNGQQVVDAVKCILTDQLLKIDQACEVTITPVSLLLLDFQMPLKNGIQVVQEVSSLYQSTRSTYPNITLQEPEIVFLTAFKTPSFLTYLKQFDVSECYEKPIELGQLVAIVKRVQRSHGKPQDEE